MSPSKSSSVGFLRKTLKFTEYFSKYSPFMIIDSWQGSNNKRFRRLNEYRVNAELTTNINIPEKNLWVNSSARST